MLPSLLHVLHLMRDARAAALEEGLAISFPFTASDVEAIHTHCSRYGRGVYFRLKDGCVFNAFGAELDPNPACYDSSQPVPQSLRHTEVLTRGALFE